MDIEPIGIIRTEHQDTVGTPVQPLFAKDCKGTVLIDEIYRRGLSGLEGFSHAWLLFGFHRSRNIRLRVTPFMGDCEVGVFATRSPCRPNSIGMTLVTIDEVTPSGLEVSGVDMLDCSPVYDIKPFFGRLEIPDFWTTGWLDEAAMRADDPRLADARFTD